MLSNRRLPATRIPDQCIPNSLLTVGKPLKIPGNTGGLEPGVDVAPCGIGTWYKNGYSYDVSVTDAVASS